MIKKPAPKTLSSEQMSEILKANSEQVNGIKIVKTYDDNYPVFTNPYQDKCLVYIPNHVVPMPDGSPQLRMDRAGFHACKEGKAFSSIRCTQGVVSDPLELDGSCPLCESARVCWDLYNVQYEDLCRARGIDVSTEEGYKAAQPIRDQLRDKFAVQNAEIWLTFPVIVVECSTLADGKCSGVPKLDEKGQLNGKPYFYSVRESTYLEKWVKSLDSLSVDTIVTHPAGTWATLNFIVRDKNGQEVQNPKPRDCAKALSVSYKQMGEKYAQWEQYFDKLTEDWTPAKACEVLVANQIRDMKEMNEANDILMRRTNETLAIIRGGKSDAQIGTAGVAPQIATASQVGVNAESVLQNFGVDSVDEMGAGAPPIVG